MTIGCGRLVQERGKWDLKLTHYSLLKRIGKQKLFVYEEPHKPLFFVSLLVESSQASFRPRELPSFSFGH